MSRAPCLNPVTLLARQTVTKSNKPVYVDSRHTQYFKATPKSKDMKEYVRDLREDNEDTSEVLIYYRKKNTRYTEPVDIYEEEFIKLYKYDDMNTIFQAEVLRQQRATNRSLYGLIVISRQVS